MINSFLAAQKFEIEKLDINVNSPEKSELRPLVSLDGTVLFFSRSVVYPNNKGEVWQSFLQADQKWGGCLNPGAPLNGFDVSYTLAAIADNGKKLYLYDNIGGAAIITRLKMSYTLPQPLKFVGNVTPNLVDYTLATDGKTMILAQKQKKGSDLFVSFRRADGTFSEPLSLGKQVNTAFNEQGAFLCNNLRTLYFASNGKGGAGGLDIFKTERLDDTWQNWSEPVNIGEPINDAQDQTFVSLSETDGWLYFTRNDNDETTDIWRLKIANNTASPSLNNTLAATNRQPTNSRVDTILKPVYITKHDTIIRKEVTVKRDTIIQSKIIVKHDTLRLSPVVIEKPIPGPAIVKHDTVFIEKYRPIDTLALIAQLKEKPRVETKSIYNNVTPLSSDPLLSIKRLEDLENDNSLIQKGQIVSVDIQFDVNESKIKREYIPEMQHILSFLRAYPKVMIEIGGHSSGLADEAYALRLSTERAKVMKDWLCSNGISNERIIYKGYGKTKPLYSNDTPKGRQGNQRLEILILDTSQ